MLQTDHIYQISEVRKLRKFQEGWSHFLLSLSNKMFSHNHKKHFIFFTFRYWRNVSCSSLITTLSSWMTPFEFQLRCRRSFHLFSVGVNWNLLVSLVFVEASDKCIFCESGANVPLCSLVEKLVGTPMAAAWCIQTRLSIVRRNRKPSASHWRQILYLIRVIKQEACRRYRESSCSYINRPYSVLYTQCVLSEDDVI